MKINEIEFYKYRDGKTQNDVIELFDKDELSLAKVDIFDTKRMREAGLNPLSNSDIAKYCNQYKATDIEI